MQFEDQIGLNDFCRAQSPPISVSLLFYFDLASFIPFAGNLLAHLV